MLPNAPQQHAVDAFLLALSTAAFAAVAAAVNCS
jgi:hypothetical protein